MHTKREIKICNFWVCVCVWLFLWHISIRLLFVLWWNIARRTVLFVFLILSNIEVEPNCEKTFLALIEKKVHPIFKCKTLSLSCSHTNVHVWSIFSAGNNNLLYSQDVCPFKSSFWSDI